jgi:hypothetical protein
MPRRGLFIRPYSIRFNQETSDAIEEWHQKHGTGTPLETLRELVYIGLGAPESAFRREAMADGISRAQRFFWQEMDTFIKSTLQPQIAQMLRDLDQDEITRGQLNRAPEPPEVREDLAIGVK